MAEEEAPVEVAPAEEEPPTEIPVDIAEEGKQVNCAHL